MNESFTSEAASLVGSGRDRSAAAAAAAAAPLPDSESEDWRYSPVGELPIGELAPKTKPLGGVEVDQFTAVVSERAATVVLVDGFVDSITVDPGWSSKGLVVEADDALVADIPAVQQTIFDHLHQAFSPTAVRIEAPAGLAVDAPVIVLNHQATENAAIFPHLVISTGDAAELSVIERQSSMDGFGLSVPVVELAAGDASQLRYTVIQENGSAHWQIGRQLSTLGAQTTLSTGTAAFGGKYGRMRSDSRLQGRGSTANLVAAYYGDGDQVLDFRTFQHLSLIHI